MLKFRLVAAVVRISPGAVRFLISSLLPVERFSIGHPTMTLGGLSD